MINVNVPVTNTELVEAMNKFINDKTAQNEIEMIDKIQSANYLSPMIFEGVIEDNVVKKDSTLSFKLLTNTSNESFYMAFTDWSELGKWSTNKEETLILRYDDLKSMILNESSSIKGAAINPFNQNIILTSEVFKYFEQRKSEVSIRKNSRIMLGEPANYPHEMVRELSQFFKQNKTIKSAYLFLASYENQEAPNLLLIIESSDGKQLYPQIGNLAQKFLSENEYIDIVPIESELGQYAIKNSTPFYKRKKWNLF